MAHHRHRHRRRRPSYVPEQIFQYADTYNKKPYQIFFRFFGQDYNDVITLRKRNYIPADAPVFNSEAAIKLYYADEASTAKVGICIFSCMGTIGLVATIIALTFIISQGMIGLVGILAFGIIFIIYGFLMFMSLANGICTQRSKYLKPYICHKMPNDQKTALENEAIADGERFYQELIQYNSYHPDCYYVAQVLLTVNTIKQGVTLTRVVGQQRLDRVTQQEVTQQPVQVIQVIQPVQAAPVQQQTVSNEAFNQQQVNQVIAMPSDDITHITAPPVI